MFYGLEKSGIVVTVEKHEKTTILYAIMINNQVPSRSVIIKENRRKEINDFGNKDSTKNY